MSQAARANRSKVFGIGFHKTGTTTLGVALEQFGYRVCHGAAPVRAALGHRRMLDLLHAMDLDRIMTVATWFDAFEDNPWFVLYRDLDERFPGSKFILTTRDDDSWLDSSLRYYGGSESDLRSWIYGVGSPVGNEALYLERYRRHNREVRAHFVQRPADLLIVDWQLGQGWNELSTFLGLERPRVAFPHANKSPNAD
jgi:hypothetical protein